MNHRRKGEPPGCLEVVSWIVIAFAFALFFLYIVTTPAPY